MPRNKVVKGREGQGGGREHIKCSLGITAAIKYHRIFIRIKVSKISLQG